MDTLGNCGATTACTVMVPSGCAGGPVKKETSGKEGHGHRGRESRREDPSRCSRPGVVQILSATWFIHRL